MIRQSRTIDASARAAKVAPALSGLERVSKVARESVRMARAAARIALPGNYRWQLPASGLSAKSKTEIKRGTRDGSGTGSNGESNWSERDNRSKTARGGDGWNRATTRINASARASREIPEMSRAMNALSRVERSMDLRNTASDSRKDATAMMATDARSRARASHEATRPSFADGGVLANVRVTPLMRRVMPPSGVSQREFARPSRDLGVSTGGNGRSAITINSSPTVVINAAAGGAVQHDVMGALRAHREELFDQLKRESARRERAQF
jgi:hypothetical protein